ALAADPSRSIGDYVVLGLHRARLGNDAFISSGNFGVNDAGGLVQLGKHGFMEDGTQLVGDHAKVLTGTSICDLFTNLSLTSLTSVVIRCSGPNAFSPLPVIASLPALPPFAPGVAAVDVAPGGSATLGAGAYGNVRVKNGGTLELTGGAYEFASLDVGKLSK